MVSMNEERIPITLLTGHLGSGKTTLLNAWLRTPDARDAAVIINEFGDVGLDHLLVRETTENLVLLENGCLCCTVRDDLIATLRDLAARRDAGPVPAFGRVVIETTGLADPAPVIHSLMNDLALVLRFRLDRVVTTVAAVPGRTTLNSFAEARKQVAFADALVVTKADLADPPSLALLDAALRRMNPRAECLRAVGGQADPTLFEGGGFDPGCRGEEVERWLGIEAAASHRHHHHHEHDGDAACPDCAAEAVRHDKEIGSFCLVRSEPLGWQAVQLWLDRLAAEHGPDLLRVKGILAIREWPQGAVVVHGVQHLFHPPDMREDWPSPDRRSRIVFITRGIPAGVIDDALRAAERECVAADEEALTRS
jgi:G3E family GTPase